jgi:NAD(P)H dehydrogenase (quinone)
MKLVITGAAGQLARRVTELVLTKVRAKDLIVTTRTPPALAALTTRGVAVHYADFVEPRSLTTAFAGAERLLLVSTSNLHERDAQHRAAIDAAKAAGVRHIIYTSGLKPAPPNPAAVAPSHYATERWLMQSGLEWTVLRNSLYADYQLAEAERALATGELVHNRGRGTVAYVAREDCAAAAAAVLVGEGHAGAVYEITGAEAFTADDLAALYSRLGRRPVRARNLADVDFVAALVGAATGDDHLRFGAELVASFGRAIRERYMDSRTDDVARLTGRAPLTLEQVLAALGATTERT